MASVSLTPSTALHLSPRTQALVWLLYAAALALAPWLWDSSLGLTVLTQMATAIVVCLAYNLLFGQGGMLSFGFAVYTGLGAFAAIHAMEMSASGRWALPLPLIPLLGGVGGMVAALVLGWVNTRKSGTVFAMISLGLGEMVAAAVLMFPNWFGGEAGVSSDRVLPTVWWGLEFASAAQVYGLAAVYCLICTALLCAFTRTPLGRVLNAVRDNAERAEFMGIRTHRVRYQAFVVAGFFAGVGGGLAAVQFEIVNAGDSLSMARSGAYLLFTFLGGAGFFFGPILGAVLMVLCMVLLSALTQAWLLYMGLVFVGMVLFVPGGLASVVALHVQALRQGAWRRWLLPYAGLWLAAGLALAGAALLIEMTYHRQLAQASGPVLVWLGHVFDTQAARWWALGVAMAGVGAWGVRCWLPKVQAAWQTDGKTDGQAAEPSRTGQANAHGSEPATAHASPAQLYAHDAEAGLIDLAVSKYTAADAAKKHAYPNQKKDSP